MLGSPSRDSYANQGVPSANIMNFGAGSNLQIIDDNKEKKRADSKNVKVFAENIPSDDEVEDEVSEAFLASLNPI